MSDHVNTQIQNSDPFKRFRSKHEGFLYRMASLLFARRQRRKSITTLDQLDDWILDDIGLVRGQIPEIIDGIIEDDVRPTAFRDALQGAGRRPGFCN